MSNNIIASTRKSVKRIVSVASINSEEDLKDKVREGFLELSTNLTFTKSWKIKFLNKRIIV